MCVVMARHLKEVRVLDSNVLYDDLLVVLDYNWVSAAEHCLNLGIGCKGVQSFLSRLACLLIDL